MLCVAQPPEGISPATLVASALSWALGSPLRLPLEPLLACNPDTLPRLQQTLFGASIGQSEYTIHATYQQAARPLEKLCRTHLFRCKLVGTGWSGVP